MTMHSALAQCVDRLDPRRAARWDGTRPEGNRQEQRRDARQGQQIVESQRATEALYDHHGPAATIGDAVTARAAPEEGRVPWLIVLDGPLGADLLAPAHFGL